MPPKTNIARPAPPAPNQFGQPQMQPIQMPQMQQTQLNHNNSMPSLGNMVNAAQTGAQLMNAANNARKNITPQQMQAMSSVFNTVANSGLQNPLVPQ